MLDSQFNEETLPLLDQPVAAYRVRRSPFDYKLLSCYAVDFLDNNLYPIVVDVEFDVASNYANEYNKELEETFEDPVDNP